MLSEGDNDGYDELPSWVREALSDYSDESVWVDPYFESYDMTRFDDSIYGVEETEPRARMFQQIARDLRNHIAEEDDRERVVIADRTADLRVQLQQEIANVDYLDMNNQELTERVSELSNAYVHVALERDFARRRFKYYGWVVTVLIIFVVVGVLIRDFVM